MTKFLTRIAGALLLSSTMSAFAEPAEKPSVSDTKTPASAAEKSVDSMAGTQLSEKDCTNLWLQLNTSNAAGLTAAQTKDNIANFGAANSDGDDTIDQKEWMAACKSGLVKSSSSQPKATGTQTK